MLLGMSKAKEEWFKNDKPFTGLKFFDVEGKQVFVQKVNEQ